MLRRVVRKFSTIPSVNRKSLFQDNLGLDNLDDLFGGPSTSVQPITPTEPVEPVYFKSLTSLTPNFNTQKDYSDFNIESIPEGFDNDDVRTVLSRLQRGEIEKGLESAKTSLERQNIFRRAVVNIARKEKIWEYRQKQTAQISRSMLGNAYNTATKRDSLNFQNLISFLRECDLDKTSKPALYDFRFLKSSNFKYQLFYTAPNRTQMFMLVDCIYKLSLHFDIVSDNEDPKIFFMNHIRGDPWVAIDMGDLLIHFSTGSFRESQAIERPLANNRISSSLWETIHDDIQLSRCDLIVTHVTSLPEIFNLQKKNKGMNLHKYTIGTTPILSQQANERMNRK